MPAHHENTFKISRHNECVEFLINNARIKSEKRRVDSASWSYK